MNYRSRISSDSLYVFGATPARVLLALVFLFASQAAFSESFTLSGDDWARPRSGKAIAEMPTVRALIQQWRVARDKRIEIRYPGGESGSLWASELRDWLVALGIPSAVILIQPGSPNGDEVVLELVTN